MTLECRIFKPSKNGKMSLVETKTHEEILKTKKKKSSFNPHPMKKTKISCQDEKYRTERKERQIIKA
jgi:hypothetical protein